MFFPGPVGLCLVNNVPLQFVGSVLILKRPLSDWRALFVYDAYYASSRICVTCIVF